MNEDDYILSVQDVYNVIAEHLNALDTLWPDSDPHGPRKIHIVELIDGIKLKLISRAEKNANRYESAFEKAARKITGTPKMSFSPKPGDVAKAVEQGKSDMQLAHEAAKARIKT